MRPNAISYSANLADLQNVGIERTSSRRMPRSAFGRRHNLEESGRGLIEPSLNFFIQKRQEWATYFTKQRSIDDFITFNRKLATFATELSQNKEALAMEEKLLKLLSKIQAGIFLWREQYRHVRELTSIFGVVRAFVAAPEFMFIDMTEVRARLLPFGRFEPFFRTPYYSDDSHHFFAVAIYEFFTNLFWAFLRLYLSFPTGTYSRIDDEMFSLIDPFTREKIRTDNRRMYRAQVEETEGFELVKLINTLVERFLISEAIRWGKDLDTNMVVPILTLINEALSVGLIRAEDCQQLLLNLQLLTEALAFIEQTISTANIDKGKLAVLYIQEENEESSQDENSSRAEAGQSGDNHAELQQCKLLISKIVLQVIFVYSDHAFVTACQRNIGNRVHIDRKDVLRDRLQTNKTLYKSICLILLRYLLSKHDLKCDPKVESSLEVNQCLLLIFLTDAKRNYFLESIDLVHDQFSERYLTDPDPALAQRVNEVLLIRNQLLELIRNPGKRQNRTQLLDKLSDLCAAIPDVGPSTYHRSNTEQDPTELTSSRSKDDTGAVDVPFTLELAWKGVTRFVLLLTEKLSFTNDEKIHLNYLFELLKRLLKNNHVAQSLLFRGGTCAAYTQIFIDHRFRTMRLLIEVFEHDFALLNQSYQVFDIKMLFYKDLLEQYQRTRDSLQGDHPTFQLAGPSRDNLKVREFRASISALLLFNIFLDKVMKMNIQSTTEKWRKYDLVLQLKIFKIVAREALPAILSPDFLTREEQKHVDLERLGRFRFTKEKAVELRSIIDAVPLNVARYYVYFSFLKMFVTATTYVYSKVVYDEIFEALKGLRGQHLPRSFPSSVMVRTQIVKLVDRFWIFPNNHMLYEGLKDGEHIEFKRQTIPANIMQVHQFLEYEMFWFEKVDVQADDQSDPQVVMLKDYLHWALLPAIFKLAQAILSSISILEPAGNIRNLWYYANRLVSMLKESHRSDKILQILGKEVPDPAAQSNKNLKDLLALGSRRRTRGLLVNQYDPVPESKPTSFANLTDLEKLMTEPMSPGAALKPRKRGSSFGSSRDLIEKEENKEREQRKKSLLVKKGLAGRSRTSLYSVMDHFVTSGNTSNRIGNEVFEERLNPDLKSCRRMAQQVLRYIEDIYQLKPGEIDPLASYRHTDRTWMFAHIKPGKVAKTSQVKREQLDGILEVARENGHSVIWIVKQIYVTKEIKPQSDKNPLIKLLTIDSHYSTYNYNVARSCVSMLANMTPGDNEDNYFRCFFIKQIYADEIKAVNYLMNYSGDLRLQMYNILKETTGPGEMKKSHHINFEGRTISGAFLRGLWAIYVNLTLFIYYKTFDDKYLKYHWGLNLLISDFFRNFFANNFSKFKTFLSENGFGVTRPGSDRFAIERDFAVMTVIDQAPRETVEQIPQPLDEISDMKDESSLSKSLSKLDKEEGLGGKLEGLKRGATKNIDEESDEKKKGRIRIDSEVSEAGNSPFPLVNRRFKKGSPGVRTPRSSNSRDSRDSRSLKSSKYRKPVLDPIPGFGPAAPSGDEDNGNSDTDNTPDANPESIFMENFTLMSQLFENCSVARDMETCIVPSDKANLFSVLVQVMGTLTEFVTGPCLVNQLRIYDHQTYIWIGIINRYIEDVDSDFYHVKLAVLEYLMGLIQGLNHRIIDFLSQQLQIHSLFEVTMLLSRLLYLRFASDEPHSLLDDGEPMLNDEVRRRKERERRFRNYQKTDHFVSIDKAVRTRQTIKSPDEMMELYKRNADFNTHLIMQIVMHSYVFMRSVGDKIKFWQLYLKEKEAQAHKWEESEHERETNIVFRFVLEMMFSIEIVHEINREDGDQDDEAENEKVAMADRIVTIQEAHNQSSDSLQKRSARIRPVGGSVHDRSHSQTGWSRTHNSRIQASLRRSSQAPGSLKLLALNNVHEINPFFDQGGPKKRIQRRFYFQTPPLTLFWTKAMKNRVMENIPTSSTNRKQVYLYSQIKQLTLEAELHSDRVRRFGYAAYAVTPDAFGWYEMFLFLFSLAQNIILMVYLQQRPAQEAFVSEWDQINDLQIGWALTLTTLSFVVLVLWIIARWRIYCILNEKEEIAKKRRQLTRAEKIKVYFIDSLIINPTFSSFSLNFLITILGLTVYTGIYTLNLFLAVKIFKPMSDILQAILQSGRQLVSTFQLMTLLIYFYSWVTILGLTDRLMDDYGGPQNCRSIYECLFNTWNFGLRESGGIGANMNALQEPRFARFWLNWVVSISYLIIVKFIVLNIVAGIIIEGFGELREERSKREFVVKNFCPICGMNRWDSEREGVPFEEHTGRVHNVWNYLKFLVHLNQVNETNLVGFEFDISNQLHYNQTRWFPKNKILQDDEGYEELDAAEEEESEEEDDD